jgi:ATP-dependent RNA helicase DeaD
VDQAGKARLFVALGKKDDMNPKKLVDLVLSKVPMKAKLISDVQVLDTFSFITVPFDKAERIVKSFRGKGREKPLITHAKKSKGGSGNGNRKGKGKSAKKGKRSS